MTPAEQLLAIEQIKTLRARWARLLDQRKWDDLRPLLDSDAEISVARPNGDNSFAKGSDEIFAVMGERIAADVRMVHHVTAPEIYLVSADRAQGIWRQHSFHPQAGHLFGTLDEIYVRPGDSWLISRLHLTLDVVG
ncbi:nuclear transport factor 2 family protein [Streptomyces sp. NPDC004561]